MSILRQSLFLITLLGAGPALADPARYVPLDAQGKPRADDDPAPWPCVYDRRTGLTWEAKSPRPGLHYRFNTFTWFEPDPRRNGGDAGSPGQHADDTQRVPTDTHGFVRATNAAGWCGARDWRLPGREELRSLVDYTVPYPGPTLEQTAFPHAVAQFYWSANPKADTPDEAWGIGFSFGFDYAYFKSNRAHVRLVRNRPGPEPR